MSVVFSEAELETLSVEIDRQLQELRQFKVAFVRGDELETKGALVKQQQTIESLTQEPMRSFMAKLGRATKSEICDPDGFLYQQWEKWGDLDNKDTLKVLGGVLAGMGIAGNVLPTLVIAVTVVILRIGRKAFCEDYGTEK
jgi:hypothetical protein